MDEFIKSLENLNADEDHVKRRKSHLICPARLGMYADLAQHKKTESPDQDYSTPLNTPIEEAEVDSDEEDKYDFIFEPPHETLHHHQIPQTDQNAKNHIL